MKNRLLGELLASDQANNAKKYKTMEEYIALAERCGLQLSVEDLAELESLLKEEEKVKEKV